MNFFLRLIAASIDFRIFISSSDKIDPPSDQFHGLSFHSRVTIEIAPAFTRTIFGEVVFEIYRTDINCRALDASVAALK